MCDKIRVTRDELFNQRIDAIVSEQEARQMAMPGLEPMPLWRRIVFSSLFFLAVAGTLGGVAGWLLLEPFFNEGVVIWDTIESTDLVSMGDSRTHVIVVKGIRMIADDRVTRVVGEGEYQDVERVADLREGQPVRVQGLTIQGEAGALLCDRITVQDIPPEHLNEPVPDVRRMARDTLLVGIFAFAVVGACVAGLIAAADGLMSRNLRRGFLCGVCGIGIATAGGLVGLIPAGLVLALSQALVTASSDSMWTSSTVTGLPLAILIVGRSLAWGVLGLSMGLGQGAALRSKKLLLNGLLGGVLGGLLGGVFFEPIIKLFANTQFSGEAMMSRAFGFSIIGLSIGLMIGLVEYLAKDAWLLMRAGPLSGKQFIIYKSPLTLGSSPKCEVYLFKDPDVEPRHALIRKVGSRHEIQDTDSPAGTYVNGRRVQRQTLHHGDQITIGQTALEYAERARGEE